MYTCLQHRWHPNALDVARLLVTEGLKSKQIAIRLGITPDEVKMHLRKLFRYTGAKNRAHFTALCLMPETQGE